MLSSLRSFRPYLNKTLRITAVDQCMARMEEGQSLGAFIAVSPVLLVLMDDLNSAHLSLLDQQTDKCLHSNLIGLITSALDVLSIRFPFLMKGEQQKAFKRIITLLEEGSHPLIYQYIIDAMPKFLPHLDASDRVLFLGSVCKYWVKHATSDTASAFPAALTSSLPYFDDANETIVPLLFDELDCEGFYLRNSVVREMQKALPYIKDKEELEKRFHQLLLILADKDEATRLRLTALDTVVRCLFLLPNSPQKIDLMQQIRNEVVEKKKLLRSFLKILPEYMNQLPQKEQKMDLVLWLISLLKHEDEKVVLKVLSVLPLYFSDMQTEQKVLVMKRFWSFVEKGNFRVTERYLPYFNDEERFKVFDLRLKFSVYSEDSGFFLTLLRAMEEKSPDAVDLLFVELNRPETLPPERQVIVNVLSSFLLNDAPEQLVERVHEKNQGINLESMLLKQTTALLRASMAPAPSFGV